MNDLIKNEQELHGAAEVMLADSPLMTLLKQLGEPVIAGSYVTGLMVYPDIDLAVMSGSTSLRDLVAIIPRLQSELKPSVIKLADFSRDPNEPANCYLGLDFEFSGRLWHISATIGKPGPIGANPPELKRWLDAMTNDERLTILRLKKELIDRQRYAGSHSKPPFTFRSVNLYEAVLKGKAKTIKELEGYFAQ